MRWKSGTYKDAIGRTIKIKKRFLLLPKEIKDEVRWLEVAKYRCQKLNNHWECIEWI